MPDRYNINTIPTPGRFRRIGKYVYIDMREDCARCSNCVKPRCPYDTYRTQTAHNRDPHSSHQLYECSACLSCVQGCTKGLLALCVNPEFLELGDDYWKPDVLSTTWKQADTGRIPLSGGGNHGPCRGPGFDSIWANLSESLLSSRDGFRAREDISTSVNIGPKPSRLSFDGTVESKPAGPIKSAIPAMFDVSPWQLNHHSLARPCVAAAAELRSLAVVRATEVAGLPHEQLPFAIPLIETADLSSVEGVIDEVRMVLLEDAPHVLATSAQLNQRFPKLVVGVRLPLRSGAQARILECAEVGIKVFHLCADSRGRERGIDTPRHIKDVMREVHGALAEAGVRDELTLIAGGGIALAEHMVKSVICGADLVALDTAVLVALGCQVCRDVEQSGHREPCPAEVEDCDDSYATQRIVNLLGAWHAQLLEVLGAMGIRDVRQLRGELRRAIFMEDIEREAFGDLARKQH